MIDGPLNGIVLSGAHGIYEVYTDDGMLSCTLRGKLKKAFAHAQSGTSGQILFWAASKPFVESWVSKVPSADAERFSRLLAMFTGQGCTHLEEEPVGKHEGRNLICTLPGTDAATTLGPKDFSAPEVISRACNR